MKTGLVLILALAALKLGAARAVGVDNDPQAVIATAPVGRRPRGIAVTPDGHHIVSGSYDGTAVSWTRPASFERDAIGGWSWRVLRLHGKPGVPAVAVTGRNLFTAGWDATVGQWSLDGQLVTRYHAAG